MKWKKYQQVLLEKNPKKYGIFYSAGAGKTALSLGLSSGKTLVVAQKQEVISRAFEQEADKFGFDTPDVITHDKFWREWDNLPYYDTLIIDEAHKMITVYTNEKSIKRVPHIKISKRFEALTRYCMKHNPERLYLLTATPTKNPMSVWGMYAFMRGEYEKYLGPVTSSFLKVRAQFYLELPLNAWNKLYKVKYNKNNSDLIHQMLSSIGGFERWQDHNEPCPESHEIFNVDVDDVLLDEIEQEVGLIEHQMAAFTKRHMLENTSNKEKLEVMNDLLWRHDKVLTFARYTEQIEQIRKYIKSNFNGRPVFILNGETKDKDRSDICEKANKTDMSVVICQSDMGAGFNLPNFDATIFASMSFSYSSYEQSIGRIHRVDSVNKHKSYYYLLSKYDGSADENVDDIVRVKKLGVVEYIKDAEKRIKARN